MRLLSLIIRITEDPRIYVLFKVIGLLTNMDKWQSCQHREGIYREIKPGWFFSECKECNRITKIFRDEDV